jgi:hypothetical protein
MQVKQGVLDPPEVPDQGRIVPAVARDVRGEVLGQGVGKEQGQAQVAQQHPQIGAA